MVSDVRLVSFNGELIPENEAKVSISKKITSKEAASKKKVVKK